MVIIDVDDIPIITTFNYLYCLLSSSRLLRWKTLFWLASFDQVASAVTVSWLWC